MQFQWAKTLWLLDQHKAACELLKSLTSCNKVQKGDRDFYTSCLQKQGEYLNRDTSTADMLENNGTLAVEVAEALTVLKRATDLSPNHYRAWNKLATLHYSIVAATGEIDIVRSTNRSPRTPAGSLSMLRKDSSASDLFRGGGFLVRDHVVPAVRAFIKAIHLDDTRALQDKLRLFRLWCSYGHHEEVSNELQKATDRIPAHCWLPLVTQILACIDASHLDTRGQIRNLVIRMTREHPQALLLPLIVLAEQSQSAVQQEQALSILNSLNE